jgi:hypothetical protein
MDDQERSRSVHEVAERMPEPVIDYVRLDIRARRATTGRSEAALAR